MNEQIKLLTELRDKINSMCSDFARVNGATVSVRREAEYAAFYDNHSRRIYLRTPTRDELGEPNHCDHGLDHATALRLRDELNDALLMRPHDKIRHG